MQRLGLERAGGRRGLGLTGRPTGVFKPPRLAPTSQALAQVTNALLTRTSPPQWEDS